MIPQRRVRNRQRRQPTWKRPSARAPLPWRETATASRSRRAFSRESGSEHPDLCQQGAGNAGRSMRPQPRMQMKRAYECSHHGHTGNTRHSPRDGFNGFLRALPGDRLSCHRRPQDHHLASLTPASGRQDHTTSPSAAAFSSGLITIEPDAAASIASRAQRVVTIAIRPSVGHETAGVLKLICPTAKAKNYCERDWTLAEIIRARK